MAPPWSLTLFPIFSFLKNGNDYDDDNDDNDDDSDDDDSDGDSDFLNFLLLPITSPSGSDQIRTKIEKNLRFSFHVERGSKNHLELN